MDGSLPELYVPVRVEVVLDSGAGKHLSEYLGVPEQIHWAVF